MNRSWKLVIPAALSILVAGCTTDPMHTPIPAPAPVASAPVVPPAASTTVSETEPTPTRTRRTRVARARAGTRSTGPAGSTEQTTAGPSAVGRQPAAAQPTGTGGS